MSGTPTTNKKWRLDVDLSSPDGDNWAQVLGLNNVSPILNNTIQDATDYDDDIWGSDAVTGRKWQITATALRKEYAGTYNPAQEYLRTQADELETVHVRWYERGVSGGEAYEGIGIVQWEPQGGDPTGLSQVNVVILGQGARTAITNPDGGAALPIVNAISPDEAAAAGGSNHIITGSGFAAVTGAASVKFLGTNATEYTVVSDTTIVAKAPAHAAGAGRVTVINGAGTNDDTAGDDFTYTA
jgi:hypothetical protein